VKMRMPTRLRNGEGRTDGEAIDTGTRPLRRGIGHGTLEGWCRQRERPVMARVAASTSLQGGGPGGSRIGTYYRGSRVTPGEVRTLTSGALTKMARIG